MTEDRRARRREQMKARYVVHGSGPPTPAPADLREQLAAAIAHVLSTDPERIVGLLHTRAGATFGRHT